MTARTTTTGLPLEALLGWASDVDAIGNASEPALKGPAVETARKWYEMWIGVTICCIISVGATGNGLLLGVLTRTQKLRKRYHLVIHLAASHLAASIVFSGIAYKVLTNERLTTGSPVCVIDGFFVGFAAITSIFVMVLIAVEQYVALSSPRQHWELQGWKKSFLVFLAYAASFLTNAPPIFGWGKPYTPIGTGWYCSYDMYDTGFNNRSYFIFTYVVAFAGPFGIIVTLYYQIWTQLFRVESPSLMAKSVSMEVDCHFLEGETERVRGNGVPIVPDGSLRTHRKRRFRIEKHRQQRFIKASMSVVTAFLLAWLPFSVVSAQIHFSPPAWRLDPLSIEFCSIFAKMFVIYNPIIYAFSDPRVQGQILRALRQAPLVGWVVFGRRSTASTSGGSGVVEMQQLALPAHLGRERREEHRPLRMDELLSPAKRRERAYLQARAHLYD